MPKMKIEIRKPQYLTNKETGAAVKEQTSGEGNPFFFRLLLVSTYVLSALAIWYMYQKFSTHS